jgi:HAD superfamily hydrolase (TIGR01509 family)
MPITLVHMSTSACSAIAFDLDGVLLDSEIHFAALNAALAPFGTQISRAEHLSTYDGLPTRVKLGLLTEAGRLPASAHADVMQRKQALTLDALSHLLDDGDNRNQRMLMKVRQHGVRTAVVTNAIRATLNAFLTGDGLDGLIDASVAGDEISRTKPHPDGYIRAAELLEVEPHNMLVVEDNHHGIEAARAAGCRVLVVAGPHTFTAATVLAAAGITGSAFTENPDA